MFSFAEEPDPVPETSGVRLGPLEVSGIKDTTQRITQYELQQTSATNLWEAMSLAPGVTLSQSGARNDSRLSIRGFNQNQIRIMLDGVPVYIPYDGNEDFSRYLIDDLGSIEVSKGYSSVLTGTNAMGGVINLVSARPKKELEFKARYVNYFDNRGDDMARHAMLSAGTKQDLFFLKATGSYIEQDFFRVSDHFHGSPTYANYNPPHQNQPGGKRLNSAYRDRKLNFQAGLTPTEDSEIVFGYIAQRGSKDQPPYDGLQRETQNNPVTRNWRWPTWDKDSYSLNTKFSPFDDFTVKANAYYDTYENILNDYGSDWTYSRVDNKSKYQDHAYGGRLELDYKFNEMHSLAASGSYRRDVHKRRDTQLIPRTGRNPKPISPWHTTKHMKDDIWTAALEYTLKPVEQLTFVFGGSYTKLNPQKVWDQDDFFGVALAKGNGDEAWDGQVGIFWDLNERHQVYATVAHKTRMPSMRERFRVGVGNSGEVTRMPNPNLDPERAMHYEIGWRGTIQNKIKVGTALFYSDVRDLIADAEIRDPRDPSKTIPQSQNLEKTSFAGAEISIDFAANEWLSFGGTFSYIEWDIHKSASDDPIHKLTSLPRVKANGYAVITPIEGLSLIPRLEYVAESYFDNSRRETTDSFALAHFKAVYEFMDHFSVEAGVNNIFDAHYEYEEGYSLSGRTYYVGMTVNF